ncbi:hypothetical protein Tco_0330830 [Tanacetum coccineum]
MENENPIRTLGDYSRPSHEDYQNTIELPDGNNVVPLRYDTICGPYDTQYCMENPEQVFVDYASSCNNKVEDDRTCRETKEVEGVEKEGEESEEEVEEELKEEEEDDPKYFDTFPTIEELGYHEWLLKNPRPPWVSAKYGVEEAFVKASRLVYDKGEGTVTFGKDNKRITFKMPYKMERFKHIDIEDLKTDNIPPFVIAGDDSDQEKTHYSESLTLGPAYRRDESVTKAIQCLTKMKSRKGKRGFTCLRHNDGGLILNQANGNLYAMTGRKAHLLEDKQIPSVGVFDGVIWEASGGNTHDLDSIWEETGQDVMPQKEFRKRSNELLRKEIEGPEALDYAEFSTLHKGLALQNLDQFCHISYRQEDRTFTSQAWNRLDHVVELDIADNMVRLSAPFKSAKEKVTLDDLFLLYNMDGGEMVDVPWTVLSDKAKGYKKMSLIVGADLIGRIARSYRLMAPAYIRIVTLGQETLLLNVAE